ncbi:MAG: MarR family winged helix-turn-helix transcriptional regulator [Sandaracinaceae bacterium]
MADRTHRAARRIAEACIATRSRRLGRTVTRLYDDALRAHQLTAAQLALLVAIELNAPVTAKDLTELLEIEKSTLSRNLRLMAERAWIDREDDQGRAAALVLSREGRRVLREALPSWEQAQREALARLGEEAAETLDALLGPASGR